MIDLEKPSDKELLLRKIDRRDKFGRAFSIVVLGMLVVLNIFTVLDNRSNLSQHRTQTEANISSVKNQLTGAAIANKARLDINLCIVSVPPQTRTPEYVHNCYVSVEKLDNIKVTRYGFGTE
jgi:hypothetical protein